MSRYGGSAACPASVDNSVPALLFIGESNVAALCSNDDLSAGQKAIRPAVKIINNTTLLLESLDIGTNNLLGHAGITGDYHGWEEQLCTQAEAGSWSSAGGSPVYLVKCGQGGSQVGFWEAGGSYYPIFETRWAALVSELSAIGKTPKPAIWISIGINDINASAPEAQWKLDMIDWIDRMRVTMGAPNAPAIMTKFGGAVTAFNDSIAEIAALSNNYMIDSEGLATSDGLHWTTASTAAIADMFAAITIPLL